MFKVLNLWIYCIIDVIGVEFGGVFKNVIVIVCGVVIGVGFGESVCVVFMMCGFVEMKCIVYVLGVDWVMFLGLLGFGDLLLICSLM